MPNGSQTSDPQTAAELRKRWLYIIPAVFVTYSLAYVDRTNYGFAAAGGLSRDLHITGSQSSLLGALFFLGYFLLQIPGAAYARRRSARRLIFFALIAWGVLASLTGIIHNFWLLAADRLLLGASESFILPGMLVLLTSWFTRSERSRTNTFLILGNPVTVLWMSAVTGYIIRSFGWQRTFMIEGAPSILWAFVWLYLIRDKPQDAAWMGEGSRSYLTDALSNEQRTIPRLANMRAAFADRNVVLLALQYFAWCVGLYGFVLWLPTIIQKGAASGIGITGLLSAVPYLFAIGGMLLASWLSDKNLNRGRFVWPPLMLAGIALLGSYLVAPSSFTAAYLFLVLAGGAMYTPYGPFFAMIPELFPANVAGEITALVNSCGALGSFVGTFIVGYLNERTGSSQAGFLLMSASLILSGVLTLCLRKAPAKT